MQAFSIRPWLVLAVLLFACRPPAAQAPHHSPSPVTITILSLNDFHGALDPRPQQTQASPARTIFVGGAAALAATVATLRRNHPAGTILLDAGDFLHGSFLSWWFEGAPVRDLYRLLGMDAVTLGNHDFGFGARGHPLDEATGEARDPQGALKAWIEAAPFPVLSANVAQHGAPLDWPNLRPSLLIERAGVRLGIVGLTTRETAETALRAHIERLSFLPYLPALRREIARLRAQGADAIIALAHLGGWCRAANDESCAGELFELIAALEENEIDAVVAGHSHAALGRRYRGVLVSEACSQGVAIGRLELVITPGRGVDHARSRALPPYPVCHEIFQDTGDCDTLRRAGPLQAPIITNPLLAQQEAQHALRAIVRPYAQHIQPIEDEVLATILDPLPTYRRGRPSPMALLFAEALRQAVPAADFGLMNAGGIRAPLAAGPVRYGDLFAAFPFDNRVAAIALTGAELTELFALSLRNPYADALQPAGLRLRLRCGPPEQLLSVTDMHNQPLDPDRRYRVALPDFLLTGGSGLSSFFDRIPASRKQVYATRLIRDDVATYLRRRAPISSPLAVADAALGAPIFFVDGPCATPQSEPGFLCR